MESKKYAVFFHNYYADDKQWISFFEKEFNTPFDLFYHYVSDSYYRLKAPALSKKSFAADSQIQVNLKKSPNKGKDIGGKLVLMDAYLRMATKSDYLLLLHDKISPYHTNGGEWKKDLFRITSGENRNKAFDLFRNNPAIGIIASKNAIRNELNNDQKTDAYTTSAFIKTQKNKYKIEPPDLQYVAGTMFWIRASLMVEFFNTYAALDVRGELEEGNITDDEKPTVTHAWERLLCWLVTSRGYKIMGI